MTATATSRSRHPWLNRIGGVLAAFALMGLLLVIAAYLYFARNLPSSADLSHYQSALATRVLAGDGVPLTEFARQHRTFIPYDKIPPQLVHAFISAEDKNFFTHAGVDFGGVARAFFVNIRDRGSGKRPQGASTITQQLAKNLLGFSEERTIGHKISEAIFARRLEKVYTKQRIIELYLNEIFLGRNSYGVAAAALSYFNKGLNELSLQEMGYLAALPKAPSNYDPVEDKEDAIERRNWVLGQMAANGYISRDEAQAAQATDLVAVRNRQALKNYNGDYFLEEVRREVGRKFGEKMLYEGGLTVRSTIDSRLQAIAEKVMREGLLHWDHHTWRGPFAHISTAGDWANRLGALNVPVGYADWQGAVVLGRAAGGLSIGFADGSKGSTDDINNLQPGDVVVVAPTGAGHYKLKQIPEIGGAFVAMDPHTGRILAMVGGFDSRKSQFNRATQAMRQPGSSFKPFVYATAFDNGFTPSSIIVDADFCVDQGNGQGVKCFRNFSKGKTYGPQTLRTGVELSRNLMTVRLADRVGMKKVAKTAEAMGVADHIGPYLANALGATETTVTRMVAAYAMFDNGGKKITPTVIDRIQDRDGKTIYRHDTRPCPNCNQSDWTGLPPPAIPDNRPQVLNPLTAYQIVHILEGVVQRGTGRVVAQLDRPLAGKTGTSNQATNVWFIGMSPDLVAGLYIGYDVPRSMGGLQGGTVAAPIFKNFMAEALKDQPKIPFRLPDGIRLVRVDARTGKLAEGEVGPRVIFEAFKPGTEPLRASQRVVTQQLDADAAALGDTGGIY